jgi:hypothetical protein
MERSKAMAKLGDEELNVWRAVAWSSAALLLLLPLAAMRFSDEVDWSASDFIFAGLLIGGVGLVLELTVRTTRNHAYRAGAGFALAAAFVIIWVNGAVGMIGSEDNPFNLLFLGVIGLALVGACAARFRPVGVARTMFVAATAQVSLGVAGLVTDPRGAVFTGALAGLWLLSAAMFRRAARARRLPGG